jgi:hypothetical protein
VGYQERYLRYHCRASSRATDATVTPNSRGVLESSEQWRTLHHGIVIAGTKWALQSSATRHQDCHQLSMSSTANTSSSKSSESPTPREPYLRDVQEILAHRTSVTGEVEVLVVMKTDWVPISAIFADCPAMQRFQERPVELKTDPETMSIKLPVQPGSAFARNFAMDQAMAPASALRLAAIAAARRNHTLRAVLCPCALCAMHAEHCYTPPRSIRPQNSDDASTDPKRQNTGL